MLNDKFDSICFHDPGDEVEAPQFEYEDIELVCHTQMYPTHSATCHTCSAVIPEGLIAMWKFMNMDRLSEET